jgi:hypothetical protein
MSDRVKTFLDQAKDLYSLLSTQGDGGSFAHKLAARSFASHLYDLEQLNYLNEHPTRFELVEFRLKGKLFNFGSMPLREISRAAESIRQTIGYAAVRLVQGGLQAKRVPDNIYDLLDLRLAALLPGSSRMVVTANANRDMFDDGLSKSAIERIFNVLSSSGSGQAFLDAVTELGPRSSRRLRQFLEFLRQNKAEIELTWDHAGSTVREWSAESDLIESLYSALTVTEQLEREVISIEGIIELLSNNERIHLTLESGSTIRILFPKRLIDKVSTLHLNQKVTLSCQVSETQNPLTHEFSVFYELLDIIE